jgi:hypothetical protein
MAGEDVGTAVYVPWRTMANTLDALAAHMPNRIDKSAFPGQSGTIQAQLLIAFRFLGFIDGDGRPTSTLHSVAVSDETARKAALKKVLEDKYADLFALNLTKTTPAEFAEQMTKSYNVSGDTRLKATRFFLAAAAYLDIPVSPLLLRDKTKVNGSSTTRRRRSVPRDDRPQTAMEEEQAALDAEVSRVMESRSVRLTSGGVLTLSATTQFMSLSRDDRNFVFGLIDKLEEYEQGTAPQDK